MIINNEPFLIEYNVRMGDPECQTILPKLKNDILDVFLACCEKKLNKIELVWSNKKSLCVVICSKGYPESFSKNVLIENLDKIKFNQNEFLFHAGTSSNNKKIYATGGRVLNFVILSEEFVEARKKIFDNIKKLDWSGGFYRKDIGHKVIKQ